MPTRAAGPALSFPSSSSSSSSPHQPRARKATFNPFGHLRPASPPTPPDSDSEEAFDRACERGEEMVERFGERNDHEPYVGGSVNGSGSGVVNGSANGLQGEKKSRERIKLQRGESNGNGYTDLNHSNPSNPTLSPSTSPPAWSPVFPISARSPHTRTTSDVVLAPPLALSSSSPYAPHHARQRHLHTDINVLSPSSSARASSRRSSAPRFIDTPLAWLLLYFAFNLGLTLYNKGVLVRFPFPYTLTALHALCGSVGCWIALELGYFVPARLTPPESLTLFAFSILYTINIAVSNLSLQLVTVPFHQVVRAATPLFTILLSVMFLPGSRARTGPMRIMSLLPVVAGVGFATYGDYYFTAWGLVLTLLGTFLAACKTIVTNVLQSPPSAPPTTTTKLLPDALPSLPPTDASSSHPYPHLSWRSSPLTAARALLHTFRTPQMHPLDLLMRMSPLAFIQCVCYAHVSGELTRVRQFGARDMTGGRALALACNGVIAFGLNVVSFTANRRTGPLTMTVAANVKQVLTIVLAVVIFDLTITPTNLLGIVLTLAGGAWYGALEYAERGRRSRSAQSRA